MDPKEERRLKRWCQRALRMAQGKAGSLVRAFCHSTGKSYSQLTNELNVNPPRRGNGYAKLGYGTVVAICRFTRDMRPMIYGARVTGLLKLRPRIRVRRGKRSGMEVAA